MKTSSCLICQKDMVWQNRRSFNSYRTLRAVNVQYTHGSNNDFWLLTAIQIQDASNVHVCQMLDVGWMIYQLAPLYLFLQCFWSPFKHKLPASKFQVVALLQKSTPTKTDSQYFHPTWPQKVFLEMYLQPKPNNRTPQKNTHQHPKEQVSNQPFYHNGTWAFVRPPHLPDAPCGKDVTQIKAMRCIRFGGVKEGDLKISTLNAFFNSFWEG